MDMSTNDMNNVNNIQGGELTTAEDFWKNVLGYDTSEIQKEAVNVLGTWDELIMDRIGQNMSVTIGTVQTYNKETKQATVNLVTDIDYTIKNIIDNKDNYEIQRDIKKQWSQTPITVYNFSIFDDLKPSDNVVIIRPQGGYSSNYFIMGILQPQSHKSLIDKTVELYKENENTKEQLKTMSKDISYLIEQLKTAKDNIADLEDRVAELERKVP